MKYKSYKFDTFNLYTIETDRFKNCHMEITFYDNVDKKTLGMRNFLVEMLTHSSKKYPKRKDIVTTLEELYQSFFYGVSSKVGNMAISNFVFDFINPEFVNDEDFLTKALTFPFEIIEHPNVTNNAFDARSFQIIKKRIISDIKSIKENPVNYSFKRALENMDSNSTTSLSVLGSIEEINAITPESLYSYYHEFFDKSLCNIYIIGNLDMDRVQDIIKKHFHNNCIKHHQINPYVINKRRSRELIIKEPSSFNQTNLVLGFHLGTLNQNELDYILTVFNEILCAGGLKSKIYQALREENELCYSVSSIVSKYDGMYYIHVGLDHKNVPLAIKLIKKCFHDVSLGKISDDEINLAKRELITSLDIVIDNQNSIINNYTFHTIANTPLYKDLKSMYESVTLKELKTLGKKCKLNFIYELESKETENEGN